MATNLEKTIDKIIGIANKFQNSSSNLSISDLMAYNEQLHQFKTLCEKTAAIHSLLSTLPDYKYNFSENLIEQLEKATSIDEASAQALRWSLVKQTINAYPQRSYIFGISRESDVIGLESITKLYILPLCTYIVENLTPINSMLYLLIRYKRWAEWFASSELNSAYKAGGNENVLDLSLRKFLFENGIDYPFSQPATPGGKADVIAGIETDDPLVLEVKVWDSQKNYRVNRIRDGLRQAIKYADDYGKNVGYVVVFNLDEQPLIFTDSSSLSSFPPTLIINSKTFHFIPINIFEEIIPISQKDKGKPVSTNEVILSELMDTETS
jgi:hypothetical protein